MADANPHDHTPTATSADAAAMASTIDVGARHPLGWPHHLLAGVALAWSLFQLYYASNVPFILTALTGVNLTLNSDMARAIHLALALFLAATAFPLCRKSPRDRVPGYDWLLAI